MFIYLIILGWLSPYTLLVLMIALPVFIIANLRMGESSKKSFSEVQHFKDRILSLITETIQAGIMIVAYHARQVYQNKFREDSSKLEQTSIRLNTIMTFVNSLSALIATMVPFAILIFGGYLVIKGQSTLGDIVATYSYTTAVFGPISTLLALIPTYKQFELSCSRINQLESLVAVNQIPVRSQNTRTLSEHSVLSATNLSVGYQADKPILQDISLSFANHGSYLVIGHNASGKSTLMKTVAGLVRPLDGEVILGNGFECSYIPQKPYLFPGTILNNLVYGISQYNTDQINELVELTNLNQDLQADGKSLNYVIDNQSVSLSTGQIQKIKLIRGILSCPQLLIIDEVISNLDSESNTKILNFLKTWAQRHTLVIIAHDNERIRLILDPTVINVDEF